MGKGKLVATHSNVALLKHVASRSLNVNHVYQGPHTNVELAVVQKQWLLDILLEHKDVTLDILIDVYVEL